MARQAREGTRARFPTGGKTADQMVTFTTPGFYPFHCDVHFSIGMSGVVWVQ